MVQQAYGPGTAANRVDTWQLSTAMSTAPSPTINPPIYGTSNVSSMLFPQAFKQVTVSEQD